MFIFLLLYAEIYIKMYRKVNGVYMKNWHTADITCALKKKGWSIRSLAAEYDISPNTLRQALYVSYPRGERIIAAALGVEPEQIWAERYAPKPVVTPEMRIKVDGSFQETQTGAFSVRELLNLGLKELPKTEQGLRAKAKAEKWAFITQRSAGRNGEVRLYLVPNLNQFA